MKLGTLEIFNVLCRPCLFIVTIAMELMQRLLEFFIRVLRVIENLSWKTFYSFNLYWIRSYYRKLTLPSLWLRAFSLTLMFLVIAVVLNSLLVSCLLIASFSLCLLMLLLMTLIKHHNRWLFNLGNKLGKFIVFCLLSFVIHCVSLGVLLWLLKILMRL